MGRRTKVILGLVVAISAAVLMNYWLPGSGEPASVILDSARGGVTESGPPRTRESVRDEAGVEEESTEDPVELERSVLRGANDGSSRTSRSSLATQLEEAEEAATPEQTDAAPPVLGSLTKEAIDEGVRDQIPAIRECYQGWLAQNPDLEGTVRLKFVIGTSEDDPELGVVQSIDVADTTVGHVWMEGCVLSAMEDAQFEAPSSGVVIVTYPFKFSSEEG